MSRSTLKARTCKCGAAVLAGYDADYLGIHVTIDQQPVDNLGEFLAIAQGRRTYDLRPTVTHGSHGRYVEERNAWRIRNPWVMPWPVHAEHRCGSLLPVAVAKTATRFSDPRNDVVLEGAPF